MAPHKDASPSSGSSTPRIAIKGFSLSSKSSTSTSAKPKPNLPSSTLGKRPRSALASHDSDFEDEGAGGARGRHEVVTGFGAEGAIGKEEKEVIGPLVIERLGNKDWRAEMKRKREEAVGKGKNLLPPEVQAQREAVARGQTAEGAVVEKGNVGEGEPAWGLTITKRQKIQDVEATADGVDAEKNGNQKDQSKDSEVQTEPEPELESEPQKTDDQLALEALMGVKSEKKGPALVISSIENREGPPINEKDAYRLAVASAPEVSTLEDYERVPVEEFGAALLRGMGWREKDKVERPKDAKRRGNLQGLGASELKDAEALGAWVQKSDVARLKSGTGKDSKYSERPPKLSDYRREKERRDEERESRDGGSSYRRDRERSRERNDYRGRGSGRDRERDYRRGGDRDRDRRR